MHRSAFAGLTVPDPDDSALGVDNGSFATSNPDVIDYFLRIGAVSHRHNAHPGVADPVRPPSASVIATGGMIGSDQELYFGYTVVDAQGGETRLSEVVNVTTDPGMGDIEIAPAVDFDSSAGVLPAGDYGYAITIMDAGGGESTIGPTADDTRPPGYASGQMLVSGLAAALVNPGDRWRLWRADNGGDFNLIGVGVDDTFTDYGIDPVDQAASPPYDSTSTASTNLVELTLPDAGLEAVLADPNVAQINVYLSVDGDFVTPSLYARLPIASAGAVLDIGSIDVVAGSPPPVSRSIPGAHQIDPDTELIDWHWKRPVDTAADLPIGSATASGDVRITTDTGEAYSFSNGVWRALGLELTLRDMHGGVEVGSDVEFVGSGGADVTVDTDSGRTRVTITASASGADVDPADVDTDIAIGDVFDSQGNHAPNSHAIEFVGSGGASATVAASGASAIVTVTAPPDVDSGGGGGSPTLYGAAGNGLGLPTWPPSSPADGDEAEYLADATNGVIWTFRYFAAESGSYKWYFIGGSNLSSEVVTDQSTSSTSFTDLSTVGPSLTLPMAGDFEIGWGMHCWPEASSGNVQGGQMGLNVNGSVASDDYIEVSGYMTSFSPSLSTARVRRKTSLTSGWVVKGQYKTDGAGTLHFGERYLTVRPIRVS